MSYPNRTPLLGASLGTLYLIAVGLGACTETSPLQPRQHMRPVSPLRSVSGIPALYSNSVKYRDAGKPHATGRSGNATVQARALMDKAGVTTIDVTTGELDAAGSAPGAFDKIQVKGLNPQDLTTALWVDNYNALKKAGLATYTYSYAKLGYNMPIQVQANVSGIDSRADVVTVVERVKRRPDVSVLQVQSPATAAPNVPVTIGATVQELNGDVGARANCVLYVNGVEADRSNGIWVDAGSVVSCAFSHQFTQAGTYQLSIAAEGVVPGDWDLTNNSATGSIQIRTPGDFTYSAYAEDISDYHEHYFYSDVGTSTVLATGATTHWDGHDDLDVSEQMQSAQMNSSMPSELTWPISLQVTHSSGATTMNWSFDKLSPSYNYVFDDGTSSRRIACASSNAVDATGSFSLGLCTSATKGPQFGYQDDQWHGLTTVDTYRWAGLVTYVGLEYYRLQNTDGMGCSGLGPDGNDYCYYYNYAPGDPPVIQAGLPLQPLGDTYTMSFTLMAGDNTTFSSIANVVLQPLQISNDQPPTCVDNSWSDGYQMRTETICSEWHNTWTGRQGFASGGPTITP